MQFDANPYRNVARRSFEKKNSIHTSHYNTIYREAYLIEWWAIDEIENGIIGGRPVCFTFVRFTWNIEDKRLYRIHIEWKCRFIQVYIGLHGCDFMFRFTFFLPQRNFATYRSGVIEYVCSNSLFTSCYILLIKFRSPIQATTTALLLLLCICIFFTHFSTHTHNSIQMVVGMFYIRVRSIKYGKIASVIAAPTATAEDRFYSMARANEINRKMY